VVGDGPLDGLGVGTEKIVFKGIVFDIAHEDLVWGVVSGNTDHISQMSVRWFELLCQGVSRIALSCRISKLLFKAVGPSVAVFAVSALHRFPARLTHDMF
jgi:hypothetical protein